MRRMPRLAVALVLLLAAVARGQVRFEVTLAPSAADQPLSGRVLVFLVGPDRPRVGKGGPARWDYLHEPMPLYAADVRDLPPGGTVAVDGTAAHFLTPLDRLPPGRWAAQAVLDHRSLAGGWDREPGNVSSEPVWFEARPGEPAVVRVALDRRVEPPAVRPGVEVVEVESRLLTAFHGRPATLRAAVVPPEDFDAARKYPALYHVPGFGGRHVDGANGIARYRQSGRPADERAFDRAAFQVVLDPESPNGHTLFADSDVNGPWGRALTEELIPELERRYPLVAEPWARLLRGHSSGGWSVCWLATTCPGVFGAAWASSPDPVDFRRFERLDLYASANAYVDADGREVPSVRDAEGRVTLTVRQENAWEEVVGPANASGQQWDSWQAVFGRPDGRGHARPWFDAATGVIDRAAVEHASRYDLVRRLRADPDRLGPIWRGRVRVVVGTADDYYLDEAVRLLADELSKLSDVPVPEGSRGYVKLVPGKTHDTIFESPELRAFTGEMLEHVRRHAE